MKKISWVLTIVTLLTAVLSACTPYEFHGTVLQSDAETEAVDFTLMSSTGERVNLHDFRGKLVVLYFGYTFCPDVCPATLAEIAGATMFLNERVEQPDRGLAVIGFSLGAYYALDLAAADPDHIHSVVLFYGTGGGDFSASRAAYLGHFAEEDAYEPQANVGELEESLQRAGRPVTFYRYPGTGHWFFEPDRSDAYNQAAATLAWERTLSFLRRSSSMEE